MVKDAECAIIISSCDAMSDAWSPFFQLFFKYWPDCPYPLYLISNYEGYADERVTTLPVGEDKQWASNLQKALQSISAQYILYLQEDYFVRSPVLSSDIRSLIEHMKTYDIGYLRLVPSPKPDMLWSHNAMLGEISSQAAYRVSLQAALWNREILKGLLVSGETGWDMEVQGSIRSTDSSKLFLSSRKKRFFDYYPRTAIKRGKWLPDALALCAREGIVVDTSRHPIMSQRQIILGTIKGSGFVQYIKHVPLLGSTAWWIYSKIKH